MYILVSAGPDNQAAATRIRVGTNTDKDYIGL